MSVSPYDARDVLDTYVAALGKPDAGPIRDAAELAYPKDIIRFVLQHCIKAIDESDKRSFLRDAYLSLGNFQELSEWERRAVVVLSEVGPPAASGSARQKEQAQRLGAMAEPLQAIMDRMKSEVLVLAQDLQVLPGHD